MDKIITREKNEIGLTQRQVSFLESYEEVLDVYEAARLAGISKTNIMADLRRDTKFSRMFKEMTERINEDPRFTKTGTIGNLIKLQKAIENDPELESKEKYKLQLEILKEMNRMIEGNLASQKKVVRNEDFKLVGVYDMTKPMSQAKGLRGLPLPSDDNETQDTEYEDIKG